MMKVDGLGGVFIYANDPKSLSEWYTRHLGIEFACEAASRIYYTLFYYCDDADPSRRLDTTFAIMPSEKPLGLERREAMINYRVRDIEALRAELTLAGIEVEPIQTQRDEAGFGKFTHLADPEGNRIELYQPLR